MKAFRYAVTIALMLCAGFALAESNAQKSFATLKLLAGNWEGKNNQGQTLRVEFRETAGGSALLSEIHGQGPENMISMFHLDGDRLLMTHYCGAGNQPRMNATLSPDGKSVIFEFVDATNLSSPEAGHMNRRGIHHAGRRPSHRRMDVPRSRQGDEGIVHVAARQITRSPP